MGYVLYRASNNYNVLISVCVCVCVCGYHRAGIPPFVSAKSVFEPHSDNQIGDKVDLLQLCHDVPLEVIQLK